MKNIRGKVQLKFFGYRRIKTHENIRILFKMQLPLGDKGVLVLECGTLKPFIARIQWLMIVAFDTGTAERIWYWLTCNCLTTRQTVDRYSAPSFETDIDPLD